MLISPKGLCALQCKGRLNPRPGFWFHNNWLDYAMALATIISISTMFECVMCCEVLVMKNEEGQQAVGTTWTTVTHCTIIIMIIVAKSRFRLIL